MCQSIPSHEMLITKTKTVVKSCQTMTQNVRGTKEELEEEEDEEEMMMMMRTFLYALTCTCHYIRNASIVSEVTAGILSRSVCSQCQCSNLGSRTLFVREVTHALELVFNL